MSSIIGLIAGISSIFLWFVLNFFNPYSNLTETEPMMLTFFLLLLPACSAIISSITSKNMLMLIAFLWSLPLSLYLIMTPGVFALFGLTSISYLVSFILMNFTKKRILLN